MSFAGELSDDSDLYSLAQSATYFEIEPDNGRLFNEGMVDEMPVFRKDWEEIVVKNKPYQYKTIPATQNKLYDLIIDNPTTSTYFLKFIYGDKTLYGYFGEVDCSINEDRSLIRVNPAIIDQYTDFIENYEKDVDVFGQKNLIVNGDFEVWNNGLPNGWLVWQTVNKGSILDRSCVILNKDTFLIDLLTQNISNIRYGNNIQISFNYAYIGESTTKENLIYRVSLVGATRTFQLQSDGTWLESSTPISISYKTNAYAIPFGSVSEFNNYSLVTKPPVIDGTLTIQFAGASITDNNIYLTGVSVYSSDVAIIELSLTFPSDYLKIKPQEEISDIVLPTGYYPDFIRNDIPSNDFNESTITTYFNGNGSPNYIILSDSKWGPVDKGLLNYEDWNNIFNDVVTKTFYKGELCELTIWFGNNYKKGLFKNYRNIHGHAKFAREEIYIADQYDIDDNLIPPEEDGGWQQTDNFDIVTNLRLWVRKPFNGAFSLPNEETWELGEILKDGTDYWRKQTTKKIYPVSENSTTIGTGIDFRDICRKIYRSTHNSRMGKEVYSAFFWNDSPYMDYLELEEGLNYYTMQSNFLNNIAVIHTSEIKQISDPDLSDSELKVSFKGLFDDLLVKFPSLVWFVDSNMNLHFEHTRFIHRIRSYVDMTDGVLPYLGEYKSYKFDSSKLFGNIVREDINSYYKDFKKSEESFKKITSNKRRKDKKETKRTSYISTDIMGAIENASELGNGMILVAYKVNESGNNEMIYGTGQITGNDKPNGVMATSYLLKQFGNYVGTWHEGIIDKESILYRFSQYCRMGSDITLKGIVDENYLFTSIGMALIQQKKYDYEKEVTICTPVYRHIDWYVVAETNDELLFDYEYTDFIAN
jgi:hypothetical protein